MLNLTAYKNHRTLNKGLPSGENKISIAVTTSINGYRTRKTCGFFTPQILLNGNGALTHTLSQAEFVARSIRRDKAEFIRTNKASRFIAVVEALPRLTKGIGKSFTNTIKRLPTMKTQSYTAQRVSKIYAFPMVQAMQGGIYA